MIGKIAIHILLLLILCSCSQNKNKLEDNDADSNNLTIEISEFRLDTLLNTIKSTSDGLEVKSEIVHDSINVQIINLDKYDENLFRLYRETEEVLKRDFKIQTDEIEEYMQLLINDGALVAPHIIDSVTYKIIPMSYSEYKEYRRDNPV